MKHPFCWFGFHDWEITALSDRAVYMGHLSSLAGVRATCKRCGRKWDDIPAHYVLREPPGDGGSR